MPDRMEASRPRWWHRYVPSYANNPFKLAKTLVTERNPAARSALLMAAGGVALTPLDMLLASREQALYRKAPDPKLPVILVCGPPRSGTTLVGQYLISNLQVGYINNLTSLFPRSPITANELFGKWVARRDSGYDAFYGKSRGLGAANDGLYIWDRWLGPDRYSVPHTLQPEAGDAMRRFFGALQAQQRLPTVNKVNRLCICADLVVGNLKRVLIVCLRRDPVYLAQSLLIAREKLMGDTSKPYGVMHADRVTTDPVEDVCRQVIFYQRLCAQQKDLIGEDRFLILDYESFCENPSQLLTRIRERFDDIEPQERVGGARDSFAVSADWKLGQEVLEKLQSRLDSKV